jgi:hypothetical protein
MTSDFCVLKTTSGFSTLLTDFVTKSPHMVSQCTDSQEWSTLYDEYSLGIKTCTVS